MMNDFNSARRAGPGNNRVPLVQLPSSPSSSRFPSPATAAAIIIYSTANGGSSSSSNICHYGRQKTASSDQGPHIFASSSSTVNPKSFAPNAIVVNSTLCTAGSLHGRPLFFSFLFFRQIKRKCDHSASRDERKTVFLHPKTTSFSNFVCV